MAASPIHTIRDLGGIDRLAYARLHIPELIQAPRALYLDVDLLLLADPGPLFEQPLGPHWAAAVVDPHFANLSADSPFLSDLSPQEAAGTYFNSGVLVLDPEACRRERISERAFVLLERYGPSCRYHDQTVLNHHLRGH